MQYHRALRNSLAVTAMLSASIACSDEIDFNRDIRPILSDKCFACHGPDAKALQGGLRLDLHSSVTSPADSGRQAIVPGQPDASELILRITTSDADLVMPPPESHKTLDAAEKDVLRRWIAEGAEYKDHWSFLLPERRALPESADAGWNELAIDRFVFAALQKRGMTPSSEADPLTLIRRVSLDLRGLPPTIEEIEQFTADTADAAYENMIDRMLENPHFGERMAMTWLDLARSGSLRRHQRLPRGFRPACLDLEGLGRRCVQQQHAV